MLKAGTRNVADATKCGFSMWLLQSRALPMGLAGIQAIRTSWCTPILAIRFGFRCLASDSPFYELNCWLLCYAENRQRL
eukprot:1465475-Amphidinium_carterae.1